MLYRETMSLAELLGSEDKGRKGKTDDLFSSNFKTQPRLHDFYWRQGELAEFSLPVAVIPADGDAETLYADVATFYPQIAPISAYMHILNKNFAYSVLDSDFGKKAASAYFSGVGIGQHKIWIALSITEAITSALRNNFGPDFEPTYSSCRGTLSYALARASFLYPHVERKEVAVSWLKLRELAKMESSAETAASVLWIVNSAFGDTRSAKSQRDEGYEVSRAIKKLVDGSLPYPAFTSLLTDIYPDAKQYFGLLSGDYDGRMAGLGQVINAIRAARKGQELDALAIAFFCNAILPGTLTHIKFLARFASEYPSVLLWYGFFSAISENFDWRGVVSGVGQKLSRDVCAPFNIEDGSTADISLEELEVLGRVGFSASNIKPIQNRAMLVALFPGVDVFVSFPGQEEPVALHSMLAEQLAQRDRQIATRDHMVLRLLVEAQELLRANDFGDSPSNSRWAEKGLRRKKSVSNKDNEKF